MKKKTVSLALSLVLILTSITFSVMSVFSATYIEENDWKYEVPSVNTQEYYISRYLGSSEEVRIPSLFQGKPVTKISNNAFLNNTTLKTIEIPATISVIGQNTFYGCTSLETITIPSNVTTIGTNAFYGCTSLLSVNFADDSKITVISRNCFSGCSSMISIAIPQGVTTISDRAFLNCTSLKDVVIYPFVTDISDRAFDGCNNMQILGWNESYAQQYAEDNNIPFVSLGDYSYPTITTEVQTSVIPTEPESSIITTQPTVVTTATLDETQPTLPVTISTANTTTPISVPTTVESTPIPMSSAIASSSVYVTESTAPTVKYLIGDADVSGSITVKDATYIQKYAADLLKLDRTELFLANCDGKGGVNVKDATQIQKYCAGFKNILFVGNEVEI